MRKIVLDRSIVKTKGRNGLFGGVCAKKLKLGIDFPEKVGYNG